MGILEKVLEQLNEMEKDKLVFLGLVLVGLAIVVQQNMESQPHQDQKR